MILLVETHEVDSKNPVIATGAISIVDILSRKPKLGGCGGCEKLKD